MLRFEQKWWLAGLLALLLAGCQQTATPSTGQVSPLPEATPQQKQLAKSLEAWNALKAENGDHYRYEVYASAVSGPEITTTLTVKDGAVIIRSYTFRDIYSSDEEITDSWTEEGAAVGSHDEGAEPITMDGRYNRCRNDVLSQSPTTNDIYLEFQANGVLASCYSLPKGVVYDGGAEVITDLEFLPAKTD